MFFIESAEEALNQLENGKQDSISLEINFKKKTRPDFDKINLSVPNLYKLLCTLDKVKFKEDCIV